MRSPGFWWILAGGVGLLALTLADTFVAKAPVMVAATGLGSAVTLEVRYQEWARAYEAAGGDARLTIPVAWSKGLSPGARHAMSGKAQVDLTTGSLRIVVHGAPAGARLEAWLVRNGSAGSIAPEHGDHMVRAGELTVEDGGAVLDAQSPWREGDAFDMVVVTPAGRSPGEDAALVGMTTVFHRLYWRRNAGGSTDPLGSFLARRAHAQIGPIPNPTTGLQILIAQGRQIFFDDTFQGNGRTCGTCHREDNDLTIDPEYIATLPANDPLFVAEFTPALAFHFENPLLMRQAGLFLVNADGFDDLVNKFVMRSAKAATALIPNTLNPSSHDQTTRPPDERVGWSGDLAPGSGTLREVAIGEIMQHFPKTLARQQGSDFVLPTVTQLDERVPGRPLGPGAGDRGQQREFRYGCRKHVGPARRLARAAVAESTGRRISVPTRIRREASATARSIHRRSWRRRTRGPSSTTTAPRHWRTR